ncbi:fructose PTS transporter subunit IIB [Vibrio sp. SS-MA-C1-2]|uniref:PTS fructose transporter subunit IIB n=1 Tax=Vibrio sp. SS-MA-C1-2 TaxID=2908646 RepID=UPI001F428351|nr:fructose PTS transporter subunit IIB [Vibrio sp. SS-MA-C1-2]UJF17365.1 fructose PTS transporter subunit IIB [Vibrio sp. SS-MA-C1-2]
MNFIAITACPTGIAHTYMAADILVKAAKKAGVSIKVETQGAMGIENLLTPQDIAKADHILIASDIEIEKGERFIGYKVKKVSIEHVLIEGEKVLLSII